MKDNTTWAFILGVVVTLIFMVIVVATITRPFDYRQGQIDALNGQIYYELQTQEDNSVQWVHVPEGVKK
jgi:hypothetical protein